MSKKKLVHEKRNSNEAEARVLLDSPASPTTSIGWGNERAPSKLLLFFFYRNLTRMCIQ